MKRLLLLLTIYIGCAEAALAQQAATPDLVCRVGNLCEYTFNAQGVDFASMDTVRFRVKRGTVGATLLDLTCDDAALSCQDGVLSLTLDTSIPAYASLAASPSYRYQIDLTFPGETSPREFALGTFQMAAFGARVPQSTSATLTVNLGGPDIEVEVQSIATAIAITGIDEAPANTYYGKDHNGEKGLHPLPTATPFGGAGTQGLVPDPSTESGRCLRDDGSWDTCGAVESVNGESGAVVFARLYRDTEVPNDALGSDGDYYDRYVEGGLEHYEKQAGSWVLVHTTTGGDADPDEPTTLVFRTASGDKTAIVRTANGDKTLVTRL